MEVRRDPKSFILIIFLLLILNSPEPQGQPGLNVRSRYDEVLEQEWAELEILNRTRYGDFDASDGKWLNITGLNEEDGFVWEVLGSVQQRATEQAEGLLGGSPFGLFDGSVDDSRTFPLYHNISGFVQGEWARSPLGRVRHPSEINSTDVFGDPFPAAEYERNLTGSSGTMRIHFEELEGRMRTDENRTVSEITARVVIGDNDSVGGNWWEFMLHGVHFPRSGGSVLTTTSDRFAGVFALPHLQLSPQFYSKSQNLLNGTLRDTIERQENRVYPLWNPWSSSVGGAGEGIMAMPHCEFVLFLQEHPISVQSTTDSPTNEGLDIDWLEKELRYPTGSPIPRRSPFAMSMVGFSPDCGFVIESKGPPDFPPTAHTHLVGAKSEEFKDRARHGIVLFAMTLFLQLCLLIKQLKEAATPSTRNRVSFYTVAMLAVGDGFGFLALIFMPLFLGTSQLALYTTAFLSLLSVVFELRFLMDIWTVQVTERLRQDREQASNSPAPDAQMPNPTTPSPPAPAVGGELPLPVTAARSGDTTPIIIAPDQDDPDEDVTAPTPAGNTGTAGSTRVELGTLYRNYCLLLIILFFLTLHVTTVRSSVRAFYLNTLCFVYLSAWCPQIYRNMMRNCRKALRWEFVLGQSAVRMMPIGYFYAVPNNVLFSRTDTRALCVLVGWVWVQMLALLSQELLGPRFLVREGWAPPAYDYHPILREDEEGAMMPIGSSQLPDEVEDSSSMSKAGESKSKGMKVFDCSICAQDMEVPVIPSGASAEKAPGLGAMVLQRRAYMVTPCRHIFHTHCLEGWMKYRLQCPNCREILPPL